MNCGHPSHGRRAGTAAIAEGWQFIAVISEAGFMLGKAAEITKALGLGKGQAAVKY